MLWKKVLQVNKFFYKKGGAEKYFLDVIDLLRKKGNKVSIFSMKHTENLHSEYEEYFVSNVDYSKTSPIYNIKNALKIIKPTTREWFATARNYVVYSNESGLYDSVAEYLDKKK